MALRLTNTQTGRKEPFEPLEKGHVRMYVCGPNLYGPAHVGHAMSYIIFDVLRRYLEYRGYQVTHVQNFTDVEDRIIEVAQAEGTSIEALAARYIDRFQREMEALNVQEAHQYPRATEVVPRMVEMIEGLLEKGYAYSSDGDVYFRVERDEDYGKLSGRVLEEMRAGARVHVDVRKEHPMDFALWKAAKPGEPAWESPWGLGRPGWHIECSAMATQYLGDQVDIHGGGQDVIFPHHENEIAQSESFTGTVPFVRFWIHNGLLRPSDDAEKMTRHLSNFVSTEEALERYPSDALRLFILSSHYRSPLTWSGDAVRAAERGLTGLIAALRPALGTEEAAELDQKSAETVEAFVAAMDDDLNTAQALTPLHGLARAINEAKDRGAGGEAVAKAQETLRELARVLGLRLQEAREVDEETRRYIEDRIAERDRLRAERNWKEADLVRSQLAEQGILLEDTAQGTLWRVGTTAGAAEKQADG
ncbi:MAG: cysteine--tRNA ligase [Anaerolineae bacterium]